MDNWTVKDWLSRLPPGCAGLLVEDPVVHGQPMNVVLTSTPDGETLIIASNSGVVTTIQTRCWRKSLIDADKQEGATEGTAHGVPRDREALALPADAAQHGVCVGRDHTGRPEEDHGRRAWSVVRMGLQELVRLPGRVSALLGDSTDFFMPS